MLKIAWPLIIITPLDIFVIWDIVSLTLAEPTTGGIQGAYRALGLGIIDIPFCLYGRTVSQKAGNVIFERFYAAHIALNILLFVVFEFHLF